MERKIQMHLTTKIGRFLNNNFYSLRSAKHFFLKKSNHEPGNYFTKQLIRHNI
jgi:hypothetical protein